MKILICCSELPPISGGAQQAAWETAKRLFKYPNLEVQIMTFGDSDSETYKEGIKIHNIPRVKFSTIYYSIINYSKIKIILEKEKFDLIHSHMTLPWIYIFRNFKGKKIVTCHGNDVYQTKWYEYYFTFQGLKKFNIITTVSDYFVKLLKEKWKLNSIKIVNGIDLDIFFPKNISKEKKSILFVGRYIPMKGIKNLLIVANELKDFHFYFVGEGELNSSINGSNITNLGFKNKEDLPEIYSKSFISIFPSEHESFGLTALESIACGTPVIVTPRGFSEFITHKKNGIIIDSNEPYKIKEAIIKLSNNPELINRLSKEGLKTSEKLSWDKITNEYYNLYQKILVY